MAVRARRAVLALLCAREPARGSAGTHDSRPGLQAGSHHGPAAREPRHHDAVAVRRRRYRWDDGAGRAQEARTASRRRRNADVLDSGDRTPVRRALTPVLLVLGAAALYLPGLQDAPLYASHDEIIYSLQAHALASTGHDLSGRFLPMYIEYPPTFGRPTWDQPMLIYAIAATLKVLPFSEFSIRLPMVLLAILDVLLIYLVARTIFGSERFAIAAGVLLVLSPSHFMHSRQAIDFQLSLPFMLAWLLCLTLYIRRHNPRLLFAAGATLGVSLFGYVAAYVFVPIFATATLAALKRRRDPFTRYLWFAAGIAVPCLVCLPWMLRFELPFRDVVAHYAVLNGSPASQAGLFDVIRDFAASSRVREIPSLYASFFDPQFLFVNGPLRFRATQLVGVFLVGLAGALAVGLVYAARRRSTDDLLLLAGFLTGPVVASLGGEGQAVWRTLQLAPFGILRVVVSLRYVSMVDTYVSRLAVVMTFAVVMGLASWFHDFLPHAQALVRAASLPLAVTGVAVFAPTVASDRLPIVRVALVSAAVLLSIHVVFFLVDHATATGVLLIVGLAAATVLAREPEPSCRPLLSAALLAFVTGLFMYLYVDYGQIRRIGPIPASALVLALRLTLSSIALAIVYLFVRLVTTNSSVRGPLERSAVLLVAAGLIAAQLAYYWIDLFTDFRLRGIHVAAVVVAVVALATLVRTASRTRVNIGHIAIAGVFGLVSIQFTTFYIDYFKEHQSRGSADVEGNVRGAFESVIERTYNRSAPTIYLGRIGPYYYGELFWRFYLIKHHREDLLPITIADGEFKPDRVRALAPGSIVITSPTRAIDGEIDRLTSERVPKDKQLP